MQYSLLLAAAFQLAQAHERGHARVHHHQHDLKRELQTYVEVETVTVWVTVTAGEVPSPQTEVSTIPSSVSVARTYSTSSGPAVRTSSSSTPSAPAAYISTSQSAYSANSAAAPSSPSSAPAPYVAPSQESNSAAASSAASSTAPVSSAASSSVSIGTYAQYPSSNSAAAASTRAASSGQTYSGEATFYGGNLAGGTCSFSTYTLPSGVYGTALSSSDWNSSANCGGCVNVSYGGKSITAMIVDQCPDCGDNHLDLFPAAFSALADESLGVIDVTWEYTECTAVTGPLEIHMKSGVSEYWFSAQVVNGNERTATMEVSTDGGSTWERWVPWVSVDARGTFKEILTSPPSTKRQDYNFFQISSGVGASTASIKVTSFGGSVVTVDDVSMTGDATATASANY
ncbi:carbohydrate-binding module family 63 protein [Teratosphaeria destructans]|uniref:Carbohydrate-binding module family 63 protein n=1 Tax=Teratosphaeria destructans TaxID=418781 RepID=A0A9W7W4X6_9PEZI|nr:carbohydrate-binding module family 63 protein [Teratosphaeria destructans]